MPIKVVACAVVHASPCVRYVKNVLRDLSFYFWFVKKNKYTSYVVVVYIRNESALNLAHS